MRTRTVPCHEFRRSLGHFKAAAISAPVVITTRGRPTHVLMTWLEYRYLLDEQQALVDRLTMGDGGEGGGPPQPAPDNTKPTDIE